MNAALQTQVDSGAAAKVADPAPAAAPAPATAAASPPAPTAVVASPCACPCACGARPDRAVPRLPPAAVTPAPAAAAAVTAGSAFALPPRASLAPPMVPSPSTSASPSTSPSRVRRVPTARIEEPQVPKVEVAVQTEPEPVPEPPAPAVAADAIPVDDGELARNAEVIKKLTEDVAELKKLLQQAEEEKNIAFESVRMERVESIFWFAVVTDENVVFCICILFWGFSRRNDTKGRKRCS
jgi:hypothetical protein